jgi:hypothetical protein
MPYANWIPDTPKLPAPPDWFLKQLWDLDDALVVLPSRARRAYILARRRNLSNRVPMLVKADYVLQRATRGNDADMLAHYNLVFVDVITGANMHGTWSPLIFDDLRARDIWRNGGAEKVNQTLLEQEQAAKNKKRAKWLDDLDHRSRDAWRSYQARTGQRNQHANEGHKKAARVYKQSSRSTAGSGIVITG